MPANPYEAPNEPTVSNIKRRRIPAIAKHTFWSLLFAVLSIVTGLVVGFGVFWAVVIGWALTAELRGVQSDGGYPPSPAGGYFLMLIAACVAVLAACVTTVGMLCLTIPVYFLRYFRGKSSPRVDPSRAADLRE